MSATLVQGLGWIISLTATLPLAIYGGGWIGRYFLGNAILGASFGGATLLTAIIARARQQVTLRDFYRADRSNTSPYISIFTMLFIGTFCEVLFGAIGAAGGAILRQWVEYPDLPRAGAIVGAGATLLYLLKSVWEPTADQNENPPPIFGAARWSTLAELLAKGLSMAVNRGIWAGVWHEWTYGRAHWWHIRKSWSVTTIPLAYHGKNSCLTVAESGTGKFVASIAPLLLSNTSDSIILIDPKGEACAVTARHRAHVGDVVVLNPFNVLPGRLPAAGRVNPLADVEINSPTFESELKTLANILCPIDPRETNKYFPRTSQGLIWGLLGHCCETEGPRANLPLITQWLNESPPILNRRFETMRATSRFAFVQDVGNAFFLSKEHPLAKSTDEVISTARSEMTWLNTGANRQNPAESVSIAQLFGYGATEPVFSFKQLKHQKTTVYIVLTPQTMEAYAKMTKLLIGGAIDVLLKEPVAPVIFGVDEMPNALDPEIAPYLRRALNMGRYVGLRLAMYAQNWEQVQRLFGGKEAAQGIRSGIGCLTFFGANDPLTCEVIRTEAGRTTVWQPTTSHDATFGMNGQGVGATGIDFLRDDELRTMMGDGRQITFLLGHGFPAQLSRTPAYYDIPELKARADKNPYVEGT
ncbi:MAG: type IV secretory system conjugative DNA transfer family protein [Nitrospira sp.]